MQNENLTDFDNEENPSNSTYLEQVVLGQQLFHVSSQDLDDVTGAKLEEIILINFLSAHPKMLKYKSLSQWTEQYCGKN